ncbi:MAG: hypothetical protein ACR2GK_01795 [Gemmatimonadaceae bacterium]
MDREADVSNWRIWTFTLLRASKPFKSLNVTEFHLAPSGGATNLTWAMHGPSTMMTKVMTVFISMDKMVGKDFDQGLVNLKHAAEGKGLSAFQ